MARIELTTKIRAEVGSVFDACLDVGVHTESMGASAERVVGGVTAGRLEAGDVVTWQARHFGVPWRMTVRITEYRRPDRFVDEQVRGPFGRWRHEHVFAPEPGDVATTVMRDRIDFTAPMGPVGVVIASLLRPYLSRLVARRNAFLASSLARPHGPGS